MLGVSKQAWLASSATDTKRPARFRLSLTEEIAVTPSGCGNMMAMRAGSSVTVIVHGTFAEDESWWKPGTVSEPTTADKLERALQRRGLHGSVWKDIRDDPPPQLNLRGDAAPRHNTAIDAEFGWSGRNRHRDRLEAAAQLGRALERLGNRFASDNPGAEPLGVHIVAHSHGGNIVLEMMKDPPGNVDLRSMTMLGTPLIWSFRAHRVARIALAGLFMLYLALAVAEATAGSDRFTAAGATIAVAVVIPFIAWTYVWATRLVVLLMRLTNRIWRVAFREGHPPGRPAYGPQPHRLRELLGREILLLRSAEDEADLMMHLGASPWDAYRSLARPRPPRRGKGMKLFVGHGLIWLLEITIVRPWVYIMFVPVAEATVEHFGLGFPWAISMYRNQEMVSQRDRQQWLYDANTMIRIDVTRQLLPTLEKAIKDRASTAVYIGQAPDGTGEHTEDGIRSEAEHLEALKATFNRLRRSLVEQFNLRHSMYYESDEIIEMVAAEIVAAERGEPSPHASELAVTGG